jgi:calcium channel MID1
MVLDLKFCDQVAYSVPSNNKTFPDPAVLASFYDDYASSMYDNFQKALAQIACEAPSNQRYSLVRNCTDCANAYKSWLCSVALPRCEDFNNDADWLQPRNILQTFPNGDPLDNATIQQFPTLSSFTSSRVPRIDQVVQPGPYKEVLPCEDLCYTLVQSCPSAMGFGCPQPGMIGFNTSYGRRTGKNNNDQLTCNFPGSAHFISGSTRPMIPLTLLATVFAMVVLSII